MNFIEKFKSILPKEINFEELKDTVAADIWKNDPETAAIIFLKRNDLFDSERYISEYNYLKNITNDPIKHYISKGIEEGKKFFKKKVNNNVKKRKFAILFSISNSFAFCLCNALMSLAKNSPRCIKNCDIIIYSDDLTENNKNVIKKINSNCKFYKIQTSENNEDFIEKHTLPKFFLEYPAVKTRWGIWNLFKLAAYTFLKEYEKILILDADVYINKDISDIFKIEKPYAWRPVKNRITIDILEKIGLHGKNNGITYCNGGVILISKSILNVCSIRESFNYFKIVTKGKEIRLIDEIIHIWIAYKYNIPIETLSTNWNGFDTKRFDELKIIHFMMPKRLPLYNSVTQKLLPEWINNHNTIIKLGIDDLSMKS